MASMQRQPSQPYRSPTQTPNNEPTEAHLSPSRTSDTTETPSQDSIPTQETQTTFDTPTPPRFTSADDDPSVKKCWICFSDSTEDTPETSPWRDPCPCALVAHEECLLDWIADAEAPKNTVRGGIIAPQILCPQCKAEIKLARPRSYIVDLYKLFDRTTGRMLMPAGVITLSLDIIYKLTFAHGVHSIYRVFGREDAGRILAPLIRGLSRPPLDLTLNPADLRKEVLQRIMFRLYHWRVYFGIPLITPVLMLSRTSWHFSEAFLTILPTVFFALQPGQPGEVFQFGRWPPSASMAFALLPYARQAYNLYYERVWGERIRQWKKDILPLTSQAPDTQVVDDDAMQRIEDAAEGANVFEIRVDTGVWEEVDEEEQVQGPGEAEPQVDVQVEVIVEEEDEAAPPPVVQDNRQPAQPAQPAPPAQAQRQIQNERRLAFSPAELAEKVLGALAMPTIAELSGELLKLVLPSSWTAASVSAITPLGRLLPSRASPKGLLQEKWGRSLVGGCLFVVFKDALLIYVRWKMAQMHKNRHVLDYDRSKPKAR